MALPSTRLEYRVALSHVDRGVDLSQAVIVAQHPSETAEHVTLRMLAWCLLHEERLEFGPGLSDPDVADLWTRDLTGAITTWVECGIADPDKVRKVLLHQNDVKVHAVFSEPRRREELLAGVAEWKKPPRGRVELVLWAFPRELVLALAAREDRRHSWTVTIVDGHIYLEADGVSVDGEIDCVRPLLA